MVSSFTAMYSFLIYSPTCFLEPYHKLAINLSILIFVYSQKIFFILYKKILKNKVFRIFYFWTYYAFFLLKKNTPAPRERAIMINNISFGPV